MDGSVGTSEIERDTMGLMFETLRRQGVFAKGGTGSVLYLFGLMIFFWAIFDGIMGFVAPLLISQHGISDTMLGIIIGTSSVAGVTFDLILTNFLPNTNFRRIFTAMFLLTVLFPIIIWMSTSVALFIVGMFIWGIYYDFYRVGTYDFISRHSPRRSRASSFGVVTSLAALGYLLAPLIAGFLMPESVTAQPFIAAYVFLGIAAVFYMLLLTTTKDDTPKSTALASINVLREIRIWMHLSRRLMPVLLVSLSLNVVAAFFWTIGPLFATTLKDLGPFEGLFLSSYLFPALVVGWFVGHITERFGQKRTAIASLFFGSLILFSIGFVHSAYIIIAVSLVSSFFFALAVPAMSGAFADYVAEARPIATEITTMEDAFTNMGYVVGPVAAGFVSTFIGYQYAFAALGAYGVVIAMIIWFVTPRHIHVASIGERFDRQNV